MKTRRWFFLLLLGFTAAASAEAQGIGGLIKRKAAEAVGADKNKAPDAKPNSSASCAEANDDILDRFVKGLEAEVAENKAALDEFNKAMEAADAELAKAKPEAEYQACQVATITGPEGAKVSALFTSELKTAPQADGSKLMAKFQVDIAALTEKRCGKSQDNAQKEWQQSKQNALDERRKRWNKNSAEIGAKASGLDENCYSRLKEHAIGFCRLSKENQQLAATKGLKGGEGSYTPNESKAYGSRCPKLLALAKDLAL